MAEPNTKIKVKKGIYKENLIVRGKDNIEITSENPKEPAIILSDNSPCVKIINSEEDHHVKISYMRFIQRGYREDHNYYKPEYQNNKEKNFIYSNAYMIDALESNYVIDTNIIEGIIEDNKGSLTAISIFGGNLILVNCQITLSFITVETDKIIPAIYSEKAMLYMDSILIKGNKELLTVGVLSYNSNLKVNNCKIIGHRCGGILCNINERNRVTLIKSQLIENTGCGILVNVKAKKSQIAELDNSNKMCQISIEDNILEKNQGVGIKIINSFNLNIISNRIFENLLNGAELIDCSGLVMLNSFFKNKGAGALLETDNEIFDAKIYKNIFHENYQNGIVIKGYNNCAKIAQNDKIGNNYLSGIHVCEKASPKIYGNTIFENMHQGILVVSDSTAEIKNNKIYANIKANIAFGGKLSENTIISDNELHSSRSEGIFVIESEGGMIANNKIYENNDGIILIKCNKIEVYENEIYKNVRCGLLISDESNPVVKSNKILENDFLGMMIRDESQGTYVDNEFERNISQFYLSKNCRKLLHKLQNRNRIEGRFDVASKCNIL